jgi:hypothetical protein
MRGGGDEQYLALTPGATPRVLSPKALGVLSALCVRVCPAPAPGHPGAAALRVAERVDSELRFHTPKFRGDVEAALLLVEHGGLLHGEATRFTRRPPEAQDAYLTRMGLGGTALERQAFASLKLLALFFYYVDERTFPAMHYDGPFQPRKAPEADSRLEG